MIRLALSDVDGTLLPFGQPHVSERTVAAIDAMQRAGVRFGLATGRDWVELYRIFRQNAAAFQTGILSNGKKVMVDNELVQITLMDHDALQRLVEVVREYPGTFVTAYPLETRIENPVYCIEATAEDVEPWQHDFTFEPLLVDGVPQTDIVASTIACPADQEVMDEIRVRGAQACPEFEFVQPAPHWCDVVPKGLNKGRVLPVLFDALGVAPDEVVVFGDAENDLAMLGAVEHSVAVANATPAAAAAARWHIGDVADDAVAQALEDIARAAATGEMPAFMRD